MQTVDEMVIHGDADDIFLAAADIVRWPSFLPHYRWVRACTGPHGLPAVEMAARRGWMPVRWVSEQQVDLDDRRIDYRHIGGATRGMTVHWYIQPEGDMVRVRIVHELTLHAPLVHTRLGCWVVAHLFIHPIAGRTLRGIRQLIEDGKERPCGVPS